MYSSLFIWIQIAFNFDKKECFVNKFIKSINKRFSMFEAIRIRYTLRGGGGGGGGTGLSLWKNDFELGVGGYGQDTSRHFEGSFGSISAILPM